MRIGNLLFTPKVVPTVLVMVLLPILISLGVWQLNRAEEKRELLQNQADNFARPVLDITTEAPADNVARDRRLKVKGVFDDKYLIFVDNKVAEGKAGYEVITPLRIDGKRQYLLVNRGWLPQGESRDQLPPVRVPREAVELTGVARFDNKDVMGNVNRIDERWPALVRWIDIGALEKETGLEFMPFVLLLDETSPHGFLRNWRTVNSPPEKNLSYAVQWFALALALAVIYIVVNIQKNK